MTSTFTHRGWFACCPVYIGDTYTEGPTLVPRRRILAPLMALAEAMQQAAIFVLSHVSPDYEPAFMIRITGELVPPLEDGDLPWW